MTASPLLNHFLVVAGFVLALLMLGRILREHRPPGNTLAWILAIVLIPYVGVPLYLLIGGRKLRRLASMKEAPEHTPPSTSHPLSETNTERILMATGCPTARGKNRAEFIVEGTAAGEALLDLVEKAERSLHIETYILAKDEVGKRLIELLVKKAKAGVKVHLLLDAWGSWFAKGKFVQPLREAGGEVGVFLPVLPTQRIWSANLRNHRKIWIADERVAIIGGRNIGKEYLGPNPDGWDDFNVRIEGPAVDDLTRMFASDWNFATGKTLDHAQLRLPMATVDSREAEQAEIQIVAAGPDTPANRLYEGILTSLLEAKSRIWCVTPYFVPDETLVQSLSLMARLGRDIRIIVPTKSNHPIADFARGSYLRELQKNGVRVYGFEAGMMHTKLMLIDDKIAVVGSANFDMRSLLLNYEVAAFCYSQPEIQRISQHILHTLSKCRLLKLESDKRSDQLRIWFEDIGRLFAPLL